jgi:esterase/lipase superfamily enzyme
MQSLGTHTVTRPSARDEDGATQIRPRPFARRLRGWLTVAAAIVAIGRVADAASFSALLLIPDGSSDPPGDRIRVDFFCLPREAPFTLEVRAFTVADGRAVPVAARNDTLRDEQGALLVTQRVTPQPEGGPQEVNVVIPYADIRLPIGAHQIGYEIAASRDETTLFVTATRLSQMRLTEGPRESMEHRVVRPAPVPPARHFRAFRPKPGGGVTEHSLPRPSSIGQPHSGHGALRPDFDVRRVPVSIPHGFHRELPREAAPPADDADPVAGYLEGLKLRAWSPVRHRLIYFATNRNVTALTNPPEKRFGTEVAPGLTFGSCLANIPTEKLHARGRLETGGWWGPNPDKHFFIEAASVLEEASFFRTVTAVLRNQSSAGDVLLFVHGYNNSFEFAVLRAAQFVHDARFPGTPIVFSWPSMASTGEYRTDEEHSAQSVDALAWVIQRLCAERVGGAQAPIGKIHVIAHSMGNRVLLGAIGKIAARLPPAKSLGHVILAAPDMAVADFLGQIPAVLNAADDVTLYFCEDDLALKASAGIHADKRVGEGLVPIAMLANVDAAKANTTILGHDYFVSMSLLLVDLDMLINQNITAAMRQTIRSTSARIGDSGDYAYWFFP